MGTYFVAAAVVGYAVLHLTHQNLVSFAHGKLNDHWRRNLTRPGDKLTMKDDVKHGGTAIMASIYMYFYSVHNDDDDDDDFSVFVVITIGDTNSL